ncbi:MAG: hypothetical protein JSS20_19285 [Proteobacteria bacterium]|nr:hypothetical protein [Pseudomonadota bacterium]
MQRIALMLIGGVLAILSTRAVAFQESKEGAADQPAAAQPSAPAAQPPLDLSDTGTSVGNAPAGVEVRIPGLGKLGVLPKFDFGLELLYGVNEPKDATGSGPPGQSDDMRIHGSFKHRF